jgi:glycosyltransferase involved in cell wall biosynthesis
VQKLVIQIPAYNEEDNIKKAINDIPNQINGIRNIEIIVINDGSIDSTLEIAKSTGIKHINIGADILVNYDADLQYKGSEISDLIKPILTKKADVVIGDRQIRNIKGYPLYKLFTQKFWSSLISVLLKIEVSDATSGFRAYNRESIELLSRHLQDPYTYSAEAIFILAKNKKRIMFVPITIRPAVRESRLITSKIFYVKRLFLVFFRYLFKKI